MKAFAAGDVVGRFTIEGVLGEGALAVVYRVLHNELGTRHALKVLKLPHEIVVERLMNEGRAQAALQHPNVVSVTDIVEIDGSPGLLMEYIEGTTLREVLSHGKLTMAQAEQVGKGLLAGVSAAHRAGLIHRDLKPANIMMQIQGKRMVPKITDFGLVKVLEADQVSDFDTRTGIVLGTPHYMAPEQFDDAKNVDQRADVFSVGVILYQLVSGKRPYDGIGLLEILNQAKAGDYIPIEDREPKVTEGMRIAIEAALQPEREDRVGNCEILYRMWTETETASDVEGLFTTTIIKKIKLDAEANLERTVEPPPEPPRPELEPASEAEPPPPPSQDSEFPTEEVERDAAPLPPPPPTEEVGVDPSPLLMGFIVGLALVALAIGGLGLVSAGTFAFLLGEPPEPTVEPVPAPEPTPEPQPEPEPDPEPEPVEEPAPVEPVAPVEPIEPEPVEPTEPEPADTDKVEPEPTEPEPAEPEPVPTGPATVTVTGDHTSFQLLAEDGRTLEPGEVEPGTYTMYVAFPDDPMKERGILKLAPGQTVALKCDGTVWYGCKPQP